MTEDAIRVLLVGNNPGETARYIVLLEQCSGIEVSVEHEQTFDGAVERAHLKPFDLALFDIDSVDLPGRTMVSRFRDAVPRVPIVLLSEEISSSTTEACLRAGASDAVAKSELSQPILERILKYNLERAKSHDSLVRANLQVDEANKALERAIAKVSQLAKDTEERDLARNRFLTELSHEIRTPLNGIAPMIGLLLETQLNREQRELAQMVSCSADALLLIINDLWDVSQAYSGNLELDLVDFEFRTALEEINNLLAMKAYDRGLDYVCLIQPDVPTYVKGDPRRLRQVLTAVVDNAIHCSSEGEIVLNVSIERTNEKDATIRFAVNDNGPGIPRQELEKILAAEAEDDKSHSPYSFGKPHSGIQFAKKLVKLMGGQLGAATSQGQGSTFWFTAVLSKKQMDRAPAHEIAESLRDARVLIVDHSTMVRKACRTMMDTWYCRTDEAVDATSALEMMIDAANGNDPYMVALIDLNLNDVSGEELAEMIRADSRLNATQLVLLTTLIHRGEAARLRMKGFTANITKPMRRKQLYDTLVMVVNRDSVIESAKWEDNVGEKTSKPSHEDVRILVAEDNKVNQQVTQMVLNKLGYEYEMVKNGLEAVRALMTSHYDLVLMDLQMPEMDGLEATRIIRDPKSEVRNHDIPIIAITADAMMGSKERCMEAGMNDYLPKPIPHNLLADCIEKWASPKEA